MRIFLIVAVFVSLTSFASAANTKFADQRSFFHPLGFWGNEGVVKQRKIYQPAWKFDAESVRHPHPGWEWGGNGGGVMHERNW